MYTKEQIFGFHKAGKPIPIIKKKSKTMANLCLDGNVVEWNQTFGILGHLKKTKYAHIFPKDRLTYSPVYE